MDPPPIPRSSPEMTRSHGNHGHPPYGWLFKSTAADLATILIITKDCLTVTHSLTQILKTPQNNLTRDHVGLPDQRHLGGASRTILGKEQPE